MNKGRRESKSDKGSRRRGGGRRSPVPAEDALPGPGARAGASGERVRAPVRLVGAQAGIHSRRAILVLTGISVLACFLIFPSVGWWPFGFVCLVPWLVCVCTGGRSRFVYFASWLFGLAFFFINIRWLCGTTGLGYVALCIFYSLYFPLAAWPIRHMYRRHNASMALVVPIVWVAVEYLRSLTAVGFPWLLLGHSQYEVLTMIQISDLVGAYGVSFVLAMFNGWVTDLLIQPILIWRKDQATRLPIGSLTMCIVLLGTVIYGGAQRAHRHLEPGPRIAVIQHDFPMSVSASKTNRVAIEEVFQAYLELARRAATEQPDLIVLPETAMYGYINPGFLNADKDTLREILKRRYPEGVTLGDLEGLRSFSARIFESFQSLSNESGVPIVIGSSSMEWRPTAIPPRVASFNSAYLLQPGETEPTARYDKVHLVLFGEYVPFRLSYPSVYEWLNSLTPWGQGGIDYSLTAGETFNPIEFPAASKDGQVYRVGIPICYEEIMPYIAREFTYGTGKPDSTKRIDILLSLSNDGWFSHVAELEQHLSASVFRAVENRIAVARSVNTGTSAILHPNGKIHDRVSLSKPRVALLGPVTEKLRNIETMAAGLSSAVGDESRYLAVRQKLMRTVTKDLHEALALVGREFTYIESRLRDRIFSVGVGDSDRRREAIGELNDQIEADLETVERWTDLPWTAPGYVISEVRCDPRLTVYSRWGDWFAQAAVTLMIMIMLDWVLRRFMRGPASRQAESGRASHRAENGAAE